MSKKEFDLGFENMNKVIDSYESYDSWKAFDHHLNFRTSKKKNELLEEDLEMLKSVGISLSKNELINICIDIVLGYNQKKDNASQFYRSKSQTTCKNYIENNREMLITRVKDILFEKEVEMYSRKTMKKKHKQQKMKDIDILKNIFD